MPYPRPVPWAVDVDANDRTRRVTEVLSGRGTASVSCRDVEQSVESEDEAAAVVPFRWPLVDNAFGPRIASRRVGPAHLESRHAHAARLVLDLIADISQIEKAVIGEMRMERQAEDALAGVKEQFGSISPHVIRERENLTVPLGDDEAIGSRQARQGQRLLESELRKGRLGSIRRRRVGRPFDSRGRPGDTPLDPVRSLRVTGGLARRRRSRRGKRHDFNAHGHKNRGEVHRGSPSRLSARKELLYFVARSIGVIGPFRMICPQVASSSPVP